MVTKPIPRPVPPSGTLKRPDYLGRVGKREWSRVVPLLKQMNILSVTDLAALAAYCDTYERWLQAREDLAKDGEEQVDKRGVRRKTPASMRVDNMTRLLRQLANEIGLTPRGRARITVPSHDDNPIDEFDSFCAGDD